MEVQVEDRLLAGRQARGDHLLVQGGQESLLVVMRQPVGVVSERGLLRQHRQAGQQRGGRIQQQVIDVGDAPGGGELERQQGQQVAGRGDRPGAGVPGALYQAGQVEGDQAGDGQQQPGHSGVGAAGQGVKIDDGGGGQGGGPAGGCRADAGLRLGAAPQPAESFPAQDGADAGAAGGGAPAAQPGADPAGPQAPPPRVAN